jgi:glycosyltransferase involved in cell wall biosynthesis
MVQDRAGEFDVIHSHLDVLGLPAWRGCRAPVVSTLHGRLDLPGLPDLLREFDDQPLVSISDAQRAPAPDACWAATIHHGLPLAPYTVGPGRGDYVVFLGRISPEKRPDAAITIARRAGVRLVITAKVDRVDREYFATVVEPLLREPGVEFVGEVDDAAKVALLRDARALLFPILWPEPFGLAMIEALACGTPVLTRRCGSTPEIVDDPRVGVVADDDDALVAALGRLDQLDRAACRAHVERRFTVGRMADAYEALYRRLMAERAAAGGTLPARLASA